MRLVVSIDVEADAQWDLGVPVTTRNATYWPPFQEVCERHGVTPTYLLTSEMVDDERAREQLSEWARRGTAEVGAHLHPWTTPPFLDRPGLRFNDPVHAFPSQLPGELLEEKTQNLTGQIAEAFGRRPTAYRAARFGIDTRGAKSLVKAGYVVDSSVTPSWSWRGHAGLNGGGPDFRHHSLQPFLVQGADGDLIELPVTILTTYSLLSRWPLLLEAYRSLPVRAARRLFASRWLLPQPMWLSPDPRYRPEDLVRVWECAAMAGVQVGVMMLHSSELMPGGSPFRPDEESVRQLLGLLDSFFRFVAERGVEFQTMTAAARISFAQELEMRPL